MIDSHCHLNHPLLIDNLSTVLADAKKANIKIMQTICTKVSEFAEVHQITQKNEEVFCSIGIHPNEVGKETKISLEQLINFTKRNKVIGIGETGLDYFYENSPQELQKKSFLQHIEVAQITGIPLIIHSRSAEKDMAELLKIQMNRKKFQAVLHCFSGSKEFAELALELGIYISISGIITFKNAKDLQTIVQSLPLNKLLIETDAPYLSPVPFRGKTNEPSFVKYTAERLSILLNTPLERVIESTTQNFYELFQRCKCS